MFFKYPKTMHLPWSPGLQNDDRLIEDLSVLQGLTDIVITEKMDGENATLYHDHYHARSLDSRHHPSRDWIKAFHGNLKYRIVDDFRICGENMYAEHSIRYDELESYFMGFSVWNNHTNMCWPWDDTVYLFESLDIKPVRVLYRGPWNQSWFDNYELPDGSEGYVVRNANEFHFDDFKTNVAKFVRKDHVQTDEHWMHKPVTPNGIKHD